MVEGFESFGLHCYCTECGRYSRICYVSKIPLGVGILAFFLGQIVMGLTMVNLWNTKLLAAMGR
jgi:hypothetical protein